MKAVKDMLKLLIHAMNRVGIISRRFTMWIALLLFTGTTVFGALNHGFSTDREERIRNIFSKTLEELGEMEVTSVTGVEHEWIEIPSAVHVITSDDIRRSGHRHLAKILRMAPGMNVGRIDSWHWAVTARTFNDIWVSK